jgi:hypothetical protein
VIAVIVENVFIIAKQYDFEQQAIKDKEKRVEYSQLKALFYAVSDDEPTFEFRDFMQTVSQQSKLGARFRNKLKSLGFSGKDLQTVQRKGDVERGKNR